jgi:hypothetical protein
MLISRLNMLMEHAKVTGDNMGKHPDGGMGPHTATFATAGNPKAGAGRCV